MVSIDATARAEGGITLVTATVAGGPVPTRVTLHNRLDGPVWPPRRSGEPVAGWDSEGYEAVVPAGGQIALGYASPAPPAEPPVEVVATERASADGEASFDSPSDVLRGLGTPAPPRDAVPLPDPDDGDPIAGETARRRRDSADACAVERGRGERQSSDSPTDPVPNGSDQPSPEDVGPAEAEPPDRVTAWLDDVEERIEYAEDLAEADDVPSATEALRAVGPLETVETLDDRRATNADRLREVATRANALAYRAEAAAIPLDALERLA